jgi:hypothetical protein
VTSRSRWMLAGLVIAGGVFGLREATSRDSDESPPAPVEGEGAAGTLEAVSDTLRAAASETAARAVPDTAGIAPMTLESPAARELASLSYEREFFYYEGAGRRDPFKPLLEMDVAPEGPRFDELTLTGLFVGKNGSGMVVVEDAKRKGYFLKPGDTVGKARLVEIHPDLAVFDVQDYGVSRRETLKLERSEETS